MKKRKAFSLLENLITGAILVILAAFLFPTFNRARENSRRKSCQSNLKQIGVAFLQYAKDYGDKFPPLTNAPSLEREPLFAYLGSAEGVFQCPATRGSAADSTDYFVNARLAGIDKMRIANPNASVDFIILSGDGADDQAASVPLSQLPAAWRTDQRSPARRHLDGANYLFIDGHVKWFKPQSIAAPASIGNAPTFLPR